MSSPYDLVGPVLPQALRLARYQASASLPQNTDDLTSENDTINQTPSREEERLLTSNANIMTALENLFSWREKDRTSRTSKLSRVESVRFQRAMYRIWLMSVLYGPRRFVPTLGFTNDSEEEELSNSSEPDVFKSWKDQKFFLQQFSSSQELFQIRKVAIFLVFIATWSVTAEGGELGGTRATYDWDGMFLFAGPHIILRCYEDATTTYLPTQYPDYGPYTKFLTHALSEIIQTRCITEPLGCVGTILDDINGEGDRCMSNIWFPPLCAVLTRATRPSLWWRRHTL
ncbi:hypothetical protein J3R83DRAFT_9206 [Lanmaoa asiatica]|nr:hypothetical protein J3R83DRAFT_9206 [Lanmaoa asiatica]